jgi:microcystin degradation protein MlrC
MRNLIWQAKPELHDVTRFADADRVLDVSFFFGFAWADVPQLGVAAVAVTDDDPELAATIADDVADFAWAHREGLTNPEGVYDLEAGVAEALRRAETADAPVLLLDAADRLAETTYVLRELVERDADNVAVPLLYDPEAVDVCAAAGEGARVDLSVGSKTSDRGGGPVDLTATVEWVGHNPYVATGPISQGERVDHGETAIVRAGGLWLQLTSERDTFGLNDTDAIDQYGYDTTDFDVVVSKSKTHFRAVFEDLAESIVIVDAPEYSPIDLTHFDYEQAPADLYPLSGY